MKKYISERLKKLFQVALVSESQNIKNELARRALKSTVNYIDKNMAEINSVNSRYKVLDSAIENIEIKNGLVLEFGVYNGDTLNHIAKKIPNNKIYGFDSFEGLPEQWRDNFKKGMFAVKELPKVEKNVTLIKGWFNESLPTFLNRINNQISYMHIDCDLYSSTKTIFKHLENQIIKGTVIVFDEYFNYPGWEKGEFKAFQEFITKTKKEYKYLTYNHLHEQVALVITKG